MKNIINLSNCREWSHELRLSSIINLYKVGAGARLLHGHAGLCRWPAVAGSSRSLQVTGCGRVAQVFTGARLLLGRATLRAAYKVYFQMWYRPGCQALFISHFYFVRPFTSPKGKVFYGQEPPSGESPTTECGVNYQLLAVTYWRSPMGEFLVAVNHNQLRTMASETVDPIDWSHPLPTLMGSKTWASRIAWYKWGL